MMKATIDRRTLITTAAAAAVGVGRRSPAYSAPRPVYPEAIAEPVAEVFT